MAGITTHRKERRYEPRKVYWHGRSPGCDPRKNALLKDGSKSDRIDARKLADLLRGKQLHAVYHEEQGVRTLKELGRSYLRVEVAGKNAHLFVVIRKVNVGLLLQGAVSVAVRNSFSSNQVWLS
jgi:hypothetical protein